MVSGRVVIWLVSVALALYVVVLVALAMNQKRLMYFPEGPRGRAADFGLPNAETLKLTTPDGQAIVAWYEPAARDKSLFIYFHGNGGTLGTGAALFRMLTADGSGLLAIDYRGYGGSTGSPSEAGFIQDGETAYAAVRARGYDPGRIVIIGQSIGTAVAVAVAANHPSKALVLDSAFSSAYDVASAKYWMFPVGLVMMDTFASIDRIDAVHTPKLFLHAIDDPVIPLVFGRRLFEKAKQPKTFIEVAATSHLVLWRPDIMLQMKAWLAAPP